jgi:hypothetical protein
VYTICVRYQGELTFWGSGTNLGPLKIVYDRRTQFLEDQLDRAETLWKLRKSRTGVPPRRRLPVAPPSSAICEFASSSTPWLILQPCGFRSRRRAPNGRQHMACRTKELVLDPLFTALGVLALLALATPSMI